MDSQSNVDWRGIAVIVIIFIVCVTASMMGQEKTESERKGGQSDVAAALLLPDYDPQKIKPPDAEKNTDYGWKPPEGFELSRTAQGVLYGSRLAKRKELDCYSSCSGYVVVFEQHCTSIYAQATLYDSNGSNVGWTNDSAKELAPGEKAILQFNVSDDRAKEIKVTEVNCY